MITFFQIAETILANCPLIDVNAFHFTTGETSLHLAAANDFKYLVELLLKNENINLYSQVKKYPCVFSKSRVQAKKSGLVQGQARGYV